MSLQNNSKNFSGNLRVRHEESVNLKINQMIETIEKNMELERVPFVKLLRGFQRHGKFTTSKNKLLMLKTLNLLLAKYEMKNGYTQLMSKPFSIVLDMANNCQLQCPGCVHDKNIDADWDNGVMSENTFDFFIKQYAPYCTGLVFYNYGEPFINKRASEFIKRARSFGAPISVSSNLSLPINAEEIVNSGLDWLTISLDGATSETYSTYRRKGNFDLVLKNVREIANVKQYLGKKSPYLVWQFLTFQHNVHEVKDILASALKLGVDAVNIAEPFSVSWADPSIICASSDKIGFHEISSIGFLDITATQYPMEEAVVAAAYKSFLVGNIPVEEKYSVKTCSWLYQSMTIDANGIVFPCCGYSKKGGLTAKFGELGKQEYNSPHYIRARQHFVSRQNNPLLRCEVCTSQPLPIHNLHHARSNLDHVPLYAGLSETSKKILTQWE